MKEFIAYPLVLLGLLSVPALFFLGMYLLLKHALAPSRSARQRWSAAAAYSAAVFCAWWAVYLYGEGLQRLIPFPVSSLDLTLAYSAYALLPVSSASGVVALLGALACVAMEKRRPSK